MHQALFVPAPRSARPSPVATYVIDLLAAWGVTALGGALVGALSIGLLSAALFMLTSPVGLVLGLVAGLPIGLVLAGVLAWWDGHSAMPPHVLYGRLELTGALIPSMIVWLLQANCLAAVSYSEDPSQLLGAAVVAVSCIPGDALVWRIGRDCGRLVARAHLKRHGWNVVPMARRQSGWWPGAAHQPGQ
jgi:hypothetical protein